MHELSVWSQLAIGRLSVASLVGGAWIGIVWMLLRACPRLAPGWRAALWWIVTLKLLLCLFGLPALQLRWLSAPPQPSAVFQQLTQQLRAAPQDSPLPDATHALFVGLWFAWCLGAIANAAITALQWRRLRVLLSRAMPLDAAVAHRLAEMASRLGVTGLPKVFSSGEIASPLATGWRRRLILLPTDQLRSWTQRQCDLALAHELAHHQRRDLIWAFVPWLARTIFWFHPLAWLAAREHRLASEQACDSMALSLCSASPHEYGRWLLSLSPIRSAAGWLTGPAASPHFVALHRRLTMLELTTTRRARPWYLVVTAALSALAVLVPLRVVAAEPAPRSAPHTIGRVALAPPAAQIERAATRSSLESELQALQEQIAVVLGQHRQLLERSAALGANDAHQRSTQRRLEDLMRRAQRLAERRALRAPRREPATPSPEAMRLLERAAERRAALLAVTDAESPEDRADELYW